MEQIFSMKKDYLQSTHFICGVGVVLNLLIAYLMLFYQQPINLDGILYVTTAKVFLSEGFKSAMAVYPWPFYPVLFATISKITHLPLESSALLLNATLTSLLVAAFVYLIKEIGGSRTEQILGLAVILLYPFLNHVRHYVIRDFGYYAFLLCSFIFFVRYLRELSWRSALSWSVSLIFATLFRIEGAIVLMFVPLIILLKPELGFVAKLNAFLKLSTLNIIIVLMLAVYVLVKSDYSSLGRINDLMLYMHNGFIYALNNLAEKQTVIAHQVMNPQLGESSRMFILGGLTAIFINNLFGVLGLLYVFLIIYTFVKKRVPQDSDFRLSFYAYFIVIFATLSVFLLQQFFIANRYLEPLCLLLILVVPFGLSEICANKKTWLFKGTCFLFLILAADSFAHLGPSKTYIVQAGDWIRQNTTQQEHIFNNDLEVAYYTGRLSTHYLKDFDGQGSLTESLKKLDLKNYDYLVIRINHSGYSQQQIALDILKMEPVKKFKNHRGDRVLIFKVQH